MVDYSLPDEYPYKDQGQSGAQPLNADDYNAVLAALVDLGGTSGRVKALEANPLVTADKSGAAVGKVVAASAVSGGNATAFNLLALAAVATSGSATDITTGTLPDSVIPPGITRDSELAAAIAALVASSPAALDTLNELAAALGNDANFASTVTTALAGKAPKLTPTTTKTGAYTAVAGDLVVCDATSATVPIALPAAVAGQVIGIRKADATANTVTYTANGADTIGTVSPVSSASLLATGGVVLVAVTGGWVPISVGHSITTLDARYAPHDQGRVVAVEYTSTASGVSVPTGTIGAYLSMIGGGGGGGSGRRGAAGSVRCGGGGGGSAGSIRDLWIPAAALGSTYSVTIGAGGSGGAAVTANDTSGSNGGAGTGTTFASGSLTVRTVGTAAGAGGTATTGAGGGPGVGTIQGVSGGVASATGGVGGNGTSSYLGGSGSGGAGGGITSADVASNGGPGGGAYVYGQADPSATSTGGVVDGAAPSAGGAAGTGLPGAGPGGGAASTTAAAQAGADATAFGAGGAGGGASLNGNNSGKGGVGGSGWARLVFVIN